MQNEQELAKLSKAWSVNGAVFATIAVVLSPLSLSDGISKSFFVCLAVAGMGAAGSFAIAANLKIVQGASKGYGGGAFYMWLASVWFVSSTLFLALTLLR